MARWGMPGPPRYGGQPVTNIRDVASPHWRRWLGKKNRCMNAIVKPVHENAMPVILTTPAEIDLWLEAETPRRWRCNGLWQTTCS
jgi:hypothetical protein